MGKIIKNDVELLNVIKNFKHEKIIMVNGCFDLLHVGHISLLKFAKKQGDIVIVAVNSDDSVRSLKGPSRPLISQNDRLEMVVSLIYVDYAVLFEEADPSRLINMIKPNAIIKEEEYRHKKISEIAAIVKNAGELIFYKRENDISTSAIIKKLMEKI